MIVCWDQTSSSIQQFSVIWEVKKMLSLCFLCNHKMDPIQSNGINPSDDQGLILSWCNGSDEINFSTEWKIKVILSFKVSASLKMLRKVFSKC